MKIDEYDRIACTRVDLRIPAPGPLVRETHLRAAVHDESDRILLAALETGGLHDIAVDRLIVPTFERELLEFAELPLGE